MKNLSNLALSLSLLITAAVVATPADAQRAKKGATPVPAADPNARKYTFSKEARPLIGALQTAVNAKDAAAYTAALAPAQAAAKTTDDKYAIAQLQLQYALGTQVVPDQLTALEAIVASGGATATELPKLYQNIGALAYNAKDYPKADTAYTKLVELQPNDGDSLISLAELRNRRGKTAEGIQLIDRAIAAKSASGQPVPEDWYKRGVSLAYTAKMMPEAFKMTREWLTAYPTDKNWRDALTDHQSLVRLDNQGDLDRLRLMRAAKALQGERAYGEYAETAFTVGLPGEAKTVLDEGIANRVIDPKKPVYRDLLARATSEAARDRPTLKGLEAKANASPTAKLAQGTGDAYYGYGDYAKAVTFYRAALTKTGGDPDLLNTRLGVALAMTGDKAGATTALNAVTGARADLARYWLLWLSKRA